MCSLSRFAQPTRPVQIWSVLSAAAVTQVLAGTDCSAAISTNVLSIMVGVLQAMLCVRTMTEATLVDAMEATQVMD